MAGIVKGTLSIGVPVVSVSLLSLVIHVPMAVSLLPVPLAAALGMFGIMGPAEYLWSTAAACC